MKHRKNSHFQHIKIIILLIAVLSMVLVLIGIFKDSRNQAPKSLLNQVRIEYKDAIASAERLDFEQLKKYKCLIVNTDSTIIFSTIDSYPCGELLNLHSLSSIGNDGGNNKYVTPLVNENRQIGTLLLLYNSISTNDSMNWIMLFSYIVILLIIILLCLRVLHLLRRTVTEPLASMTRLAENILKYNYVTPSEKCDRSELGELNDKLELISLELQRAAENEKMLKERDENLLASISHDLKTPIATINGCAECIRDGIAKSEKQLNDYSCTIIAKSQLLTKMINSIIENSAITMNDFKLNQYETYLKSYLTEIITNLSPDLEQRGLSWNIGRIDDLLVMIDPDMIYKVIQNIVGNSVKYTKPGGTVSIRTEEMSDRHSVMIEITDTGEGIAPEDIPFVFDRFFRSERARTQNIPGNGLGLSIVKNIVSLHGGIIECESIQGRGTTVAFSVPLA